MSLESDKKLPLEELKRRNKPQPPTAALPPAMPLPIPSVCPLTPQDVDEIFEILIVLQARMKAIEQQNCSLKTQLNNLPTQTELTQINRTLSQIQQTLSQAGKKKEKSFSIRNWRLPRIQFNPMWLLLIPILAALWAVWFSLEKLLSGWAMLL